MLQGLVDLFPAALDLLVGDDDAFGLAVVDVLAGGLRGETAFGERAGREGVRRAADRVAEGEGVALLRREELQAACDYLIEGGTCIIAPDGRFLAGPVFKEETILYADLDLNETIRSSQLMDITGHYARPEVLSLRVNQMQYRALDQGR
jgi:hypothetical protein